MLIYLHGPDSYLRLRKKSWYLDEFVRKHSVSGIGHFDISSEEETEALSAFLSHQSLFNNIKLACIDGIFSRDDRFVKNLLAPYAEADYVHVLISEEKAPPANFTTLLKKGKVMRFDNLKGAEWRRFVVQEAELLGVSLEKPACDFLADVYEGDSWRLATELNKMRGFGARLIGMRELERLGIEFSPDSWGLIRGMCSKDAAVRLGSLEHIFLKQEPAAKTFNILSSLWSEKISHFAAYDKAVKIGKLEYEEVLVALVLS